MLRRDEVGGESSGNDDDAAPAVRVIVGLVFRRALWPRSWTKFCEARAGVLSCVDTGEEGGVCLPYVLLASGCIVQHLVSRGVRACGREFNVSIGVAAYFRCFRHRGRGWNIFVRLSCPTSAGTITALAFVRHGHVILFDAEADGLGAKLPCHSHVQKSKGVGVGVVHRA